MNRMPAVFPGTVMLLTVLLCGGQCDWRDEDLESVLMERSGPEAIDCGFAFSYGGEPTAQRVRACVEAALQTAQPFFARVVSDCDQKRVGRAYRRDY